MKKISKKNMINFLSVTERILLDNNFERSIFTDKFNPMYEWVKETKDFGKVYFNPDNSIDTNIYSIFGRFEDVEMIKKINPISIEKFNINQYSGKCNFHCSDLVGLIYTFKRFLNYIDK